MAPIFTELITSLLVPAQSAEANGVDGAASNRDKLIALLTNEVGFSRLYEGAIGELCWQPLADVDIHQLENVVGTEKFRQIEKENRGKNVLRCYRVLNKSNRLGYSNYNPYMNKRYPFISYSDRHVVHSHRYK